MYSTPTFRVELELTKGQLSAVNKALGLHYSPNAKSIQPKTSIEALIRAVERKQLTINYTEI